MAVMIGGLLALATPAEAQRRGGGGGRQGGGGSGANFHRGHSNNHGHHHHNRGRVNVYFGGFGYPGFYGYPYYGYPYYGYPFGFGYGYGYPVTAYRTYDPRGIYEGRVANPGQSTNDGRGKETSMARSVQRQLSAAGYYRGAIDGVVGDGTRRAIRNFERDNGLPVDGRIDAQLISTMGLG